MIFPDPPRMWRRRHVLVSTLCAGLSLAMFATVQAQQSHVQEAPSQARIATVRRALVALSGTVLLSPSNTCPMQSDADVNAGQEPATMDHPRHLTMLLTQYRAEVIIVGVLLCLLLMTLAVLLRERLSKLNALRAVHQHLADMAHLQRNVTGSIYAGAIAHEINQPLTAIVSNVDTFDLLVDRQPMDLQQVREILADIRADCLRTSTLVLRMKSLLNKTEVSRQDIDINDAISRVLELRFLHQLMAKHQIELQRQVNTQSLIVSADEVQLQQVIGNILLNSIEAIASAEAGLSTRCIVISTLAKKGGMAQITVRDTGPGFGDSVAKVFQPFYTNKTTGMGMGLSIAQAIVHSIGGYIHAENHVEGGAVLTVTLPLSRKLK